MRNKENKWWGVNYEVRIRSRKGSGGSLLRAQGSLPDRKGTSASRGRTGTASSLSVPTTPSPSSGPFSSFLKDVGTLTLGWACPSLWYSPTRLSVLPLSAFFPGVLPMPLLQGVFLLEKEETAQCAVGPSTDTSSDVGHLLTVSILPAAKQCKSFILKQLRYIMV